MPTVGSAVVRTPPQFLSRIEARSAKIGVIGLGYVGLPLVLLFSSEKFAITGFDVDQRKVDTLNSGGSYIVRIEPSQIQSAREPGFTPTSDFAHIGRPHYRPLLSVSVATEGPAIRSRK